METNNCTVEERLKAEVLGMEEIAIGSCLLRDSYEEFRSSVNRFIGVLIYATERNTREGILCRELMHDIRRQIEQYQDEKGFKF